MPARSAAALERKRELLREWKRNNPDKVRLQKKKYYARNKTKRRNELNRWREKNPEKVKIQRRQYRERKAWPRSLKPWRRKPCRYNFRKTTRQAVIKRDLLEARVELIDFRKTARQPAKDKTVSLEAPVELIDFRKTARQSVKDKKILLEACVELIDFRKTTRQAAKDMQAAEDFDPDETLKELFPAKATRQSTKDMQTMEDFDPDEILKGLFPTKSPQREPHNFVNSEANEASAMELETTIAEPESPPREQYNSSSDSSDSEVDEALAKELDAMLAEPESPPREQYNSSSSSSSDSEVDEALAKELDAMLTEPEDPVKRRINQIRNNRKKAGENRVARIQKRREEEAMIVEMASELDKMMFMIHDMGKWFAEFERENKVERASQFEYSRTIEITTELMSELEQYLFS